MTSGTSGGDEDLTTWADRIEAVIARTEGCFVDQVVVVAKTASTQDTAAGMFKEGKGLMLITGEQQAGRGRRGRRWDTGPHGLAVTFAVPDTGEPSQWLSLVGGLAMYKACHGQAGEHADRLRIKLPNDLVVLRADGPRRLKLGGVLVERRQGLLLIGIGINVLQEDENWRSVLRGTAISLAQLGSGDSRISLAERLLGTMNEVWSMDRVAAEQELGSVMDTNA